MLESRDPANTSFCITRCITNLMENIRLSRAHKFIDIETAGDTRQCGVNIDVDAQQMLTTLRRVKIASVLGPHSIAHFNIDWENPEETNPNEDEGYLREFMNVFESKMMELIERAVSHQRAVTCDFHVVEILQHLTVCRHRSQVCLILYTNNPVIYTQLYCVIVVFILEENLLDPRWSRMVPSPGPKSIFGLL